MDVGSQPRGCWQPTTWLLAANHMVCWQLRVMLAWYQKRYSSVQKKMAFNKKKCYPTTFFAKKGIVLFKKNGV